MSTSTPKDFESRGLRKEFEQCHNCHIAKSDATKSRPVKLRECTGCHTATYCSRKCQRAHWKAHKPRCELHQKMVQTLESREERLRQRALPGPDGTYVPPRLQPRDILDEMTSWKKHFRPILFQAGFNALNIVNDPQKWISHVMLVTISRIDQAEDPRPWTRYRVNSAECVFIGDLPRRMGMGPPEMRSVVEQKCTMDEQNLRQGFKGTIAAILNITCPAVDPMIELNNVVYTAYDSSVAKGLKITDNWAQDFIDAVERMCERSQ
ncbi:unnamed protein product [Somion occarium]|uniref:MYND-type domain-containing protein n=1 Tax=Somion occarium TaxID=3059160 RepID=A0ABP1CW46_9APHY